MRRIKLLLGSVAVVVAGLCSAQAQAQTPASEYVMIVLDQTGSMNQLAGSGTLTMFDNGVSGAQSWINSIDTQNLIRRAYAIWTFKDDTCCGGTQAGARKAWPKVASDCSFVTGTTYETATGFCIINANATAPYGSLITLLDSVRPAVNGGGDPHGLLSTVQGGTGGATFDTASFGLGPNTPLASSFCKTVETLQILRPTVPRIYTFESDGGENFSSGVCSGAAATTLPPEGQALPRNAADLGYAPGNAWQTAALRRSTRLVTRPPVSDGLTPQSALTDQPIDTQAVVTDGAIHTPQFSPPGTDDFAPGMSFRVDALFAICTAGDGTQPLPCPQQPATAQFSALMAPQQIASEGASHPGIAALAAPATTAAATTGTTFRSISDGDFSFFSALGHANSKSKFRTIVRDPSVVFGTTHKLAGDVDDSGCTDIADFKIITQKDVYFQRAVQPLQIAIRADLNRDGWVNRLDAQIVLNNWGKGCINPVGPKPVIP